MILLLSFDVRRQGGIERLSLQVQASLQRSGKRVLLLCPRRIGPGTLGRLLGRARFLLALSLCLPRATEVLSMHALLLKPVQWLNLLRPRRQRLFCWLHGIEVWGSALDTVTTQLRSCDRLLASSRFTQERILEQPGPWPMVAVVHPMADLIDPTKVPEPLPASLTLLTVARMDANERYKGHRLVISALSLLQQTGSLPESWRWRVVGGGDDRNRLEAEVKQRGLMPWVHFLGNLPDAELEHEIRHCSVLLMPSSYSLEADGRACGEGFGIVYLEAAQAGRAAIGCRLGGQSDLIRDERTGWLIDPEAEMLAGLLQRLGRQPTLLAQAGIQARQRAIDSFSQERFDQALTSALST